MCFAWVHFFFFFNHLNQEHRTLCEFPSGNPEPSLKPRHRFLVSVPHTRLFFLGTPCDCGLLPRRGGFSAGAGGGCLGKGSTSRRSHSGMACHRYGPGCGTPTGPSAGTSSAELAYKGHDSHVESHVPVKTSLLVEGLAAVDADQPLVVRVRVSFS